MARPLDANALLTAGLGSRAAAATMLSTVAASSLPAGSESVAKAGDTMTGQLAFATGTPQPPFVLSADEQGETVIGLDADTVDGIHGAVLVTNDADQTIPWAWLIKTLSVNDPADSFGMGAPGGVFGALVPTMDNLFNFGTATHRWKDAHLARVYTGRVDTDTAVIGTGGLSVLTGSSSSIAGTVSFPEGLSASGIALDTDTSLVADGSGASRLVYAVQGDDTYGNTSRVQIQTRSNSGYPSGLSCSVFMDANNQSGYGITGIARNKTGSTPTGCSYYGLQFYVQPSGAFAFARAADVSNIGGGSASGSAWLLTARDSYNGTAPVGGGLDIWGESQNGAYSTWYGARIYYGHGGACSNAYGLYVRTPYDQDTQATVNYAHIALEDPTYWQTGQVDALKVGAVANLPGATTGNIRFLGGNWDTGHLQLENGHVWNDATNNVIRFKGSSPASETDGVSAFTGSVALGGGATATLGTIGGSGPTGAAQAGWAPLYIGGNLRFMPYWS